MDLGLTGETVAVTGATSWIGRAVAERLSGEGARGLLVSRDEGGIAASRDALPGGAHVVLSADGTGVASVACIGASDRGEL